MPSSVRRSNLGICRNDLGYREVPEQTLNERYCSESPDYDGDDERPSEHEELVEKCFIPAEKRLNALFELLSEINNVLHMTVSIF